MLCCWYRWRISLSLDAGGSAPPRLAKHLARCPACAAFHKTSAAAAARLKEEAKSFAPELPPFLHTKIMAGIRGGPAPAANRRLLLRPALTWAAAALALLLAAAWLLLPAGRPAARPPAPAAADAGRPSDELALLTAPLGLVAEVPAALPDPLGDEVRSLQGDILAATDFLMRCIGRPAPAVRDGG
ncbi:MAG: hypothetical protein JXR37_24705 [Kiritimatiellae bacterium]|nr:hypothetical protein [Kiritimatiellia bacterium]